MRASFSNVARKILTKSSRFSLLILTISPQAGKINPKQNTTITKTLEHQFLQKQNFLLHKHIANRMTGWENVNMKHLFSFNRKLQTAVRFPIIHSCFAIGTFYRIIFLFTLKLFLNILTVSACLFVSWVNFICFLWNAFLYIIGKMTGRRSTTMWGSATTSD